VYLYGCYVLFCVGVVFAEDSYYAIGWCLCGDKVMGGERVFVG
jgi:hypothetical protein